MIENFLSSNKILQIEQKNNPEMKNIVKTITCLDIKIDPYSLKFK